MSLPNLSYMTSVGELRYIQAFHESGAFRGPDMAVLDFLTPAQRFRCDLRGKFRREKLRLQPLYSYILARTKYYDEVFLDAISDKADFIVNLGCGTDTRAHRFGHILQQKGIRVLECDQAEAILAKEKLARIRWPTAHLQYMAVDLSREAPELEGWLRKNRGARIHVMLEGVSPYLSVEAFERFLRLLAGQLEPGCVLAYDFKVRESIPAGKAFFGLPADEGAVSAYHSALGFRQTKFELSEGITRRCLPGTSLALELFFREDALTSLVVQGKK